MCEYNVNAGVKSLIALGCGGLALSNTLVVACKSLIALGRGGLASPLLPLGDNPPARAAPLGRLRARSDGCLTNTLSVV